MYYRNRNYWRRNNYRNRRYRNKYGEPPIVYLVGAILLVLGKTIYVLIRSTASLVGWIWGKIMGRKGANIYPESSKIPSADVPRVDGIAETFKPILGKGTEVPKPRYFKKHSMLTAAESSFYEVLDEIARQNNYIIQTKVRLEGLIGVHFYAENWFGLRNRIKSREMDFVLCEKRDSNLNQILVIELDDSSHLRDDRVARDKNLDDILGEAGLPILHVQVASNYDSNDLLRKIKEKIGVVG